MMYENDVKTVWKQIETKILLIKKFYKINIQLVRIKIERLLNYILLGP